MAWVIDLLWRKWDMLASKEAVKFCIPITDAQNILYFYFGVLQFNCNYFCTQLTSSPPQHCKSHEEAHDTVKEPLYLQFLVYSWCSINIENARVNWFKKTEGKYSRRWHPYQLFYFPFLPTPILVHFLAPSLTSTSFRYTFPEPPWTVPYEHFGLMNR